MKAVIESLARIPGVRFATIISRDGVPIACRGEALDEDSKEEREGRDWVDSADDVNAFAALAAGWLADLTRIVDCVTWDPPRRVVLHAQRGTLILLNAEQAIFGVMLERGMAAEELRLPLEAAVARLGRQLERRNTREQTTAPRDGIEPIERTGNQIPEASQES